MTQAERRLYLIRSLLNEKTEYQSLNVPRDAGEQRKLLRSLMNVRMPKVADEAFLRVQDEYLQQELADEGVTDLDDLRPVSGDLYLWQGAHRRRRAAVPLAGGHHVPQVRGHRQRREQLMLRFH